MQAIQSLARRRKLLFIDASGSSPYNDHAGLLHDGSLWSHVVTKRETPSRLSTINIAIEKSKYWSTDEATG